MKITKISILSIPILFAVIFILGCDLEYRTVTVNDLIEHTAAYEGQKIQVRGKYEPTGGFPVPACMYQETGKQPEIVGTTIFRSQWGITAPNGRYLGVQVVNNQKYYDYNYEKGQTMTLKGTARIAIVKDYCVSHRLYEAVYLEVRGEDLPLP